MLQTLAPVALPFVASGYWIVGVLWLSVVAGLDVVKRPVATRSWLVGWCVMLVPSLLTLPVGLLLTDFPVGPQLRAAVTTCLALPWVLAAPTSSAAMLLGSVRALRSERVHQGGWVQLGISLGFPLIVALPLLGEWAPFGHFKGRFAFLAAAWLPMGASLTAWILLHRGEGDERFSQARRLSATWMLAAGGWWGVGWLTLAAMAAASNRDTTLLRVATDAGQFVVGFALICGIVLTIERRPMTAPLAIAGVPALCVVPLGVAWSTWHGRVDHFDLPTASRGVWLPEEHHDCVWVGPAAVPDATPCARSPSGRRLRALAPDQPSTLLDPDDELLVRVGPLPFVIAFGAATHADLVWEDDQWKTPNDWSPKSRKPLALRLHPDATVQDVVDACTRRPWGACALFVPPPPGSWDGEPLIDPPAP